MDMEALILALKNELTNINTFNERINLIAQYTKKYTGAERCSIFVYKEEKNQLQSIYSDGIKSLILKSNAGLVGYAFHKKQTVIENDIANSEIFFKAVDKKSGYKTAVVIAVPIINTDNNRLGVIQLLNKPGGFNESDKAFIESLAILLLPLLAPTAVVKNDDQSDALATTNNSTTLEEKLDIYLDDKRLFLMEDGNAYYKILEMKREYFIGADKCYLLNEAPKEINIFYYAMGEDFLSVNMGVKIDHQIDGVLIKESGIQQDFSRYTLEEDE